MQIKLIYGSFTSSYKSVSLLTKAKDNLNLLVFSEETSESMVCDTFVNSCQDVLHLEAVSNCSLGAFITVEKIITERYLYDLSTLLLI